MKLYIFYILLLSSCASAPSIVFEKGCQKKITCVKSDGMRCETVLIETAGECALTATSMNEIRDE